MTEVLLDVKKLSKNFESKKITVKAVSDLSFKIYKGETFGLVGESGSGKTTAGRCIARVIDSTDGEVFYKAEDKEQYDFLNIPKYDYKRLRREIQMIFQDPYASLDPRMTVYDIIGEPLMANFKLTKAEYDSRIQSMAEQVGLNVSYLRRYPHAFSGGQRQRIGIARALITLPRLVICDEAVSALDVSVQAQTINLLKELQVEFGLTYIFISHDLSVVEYISDKIGVMYLGKLVEMAETNELFNNTKHPYTQALLSAVPVPDPKNKTIRIPLKGEIPNPGNPPTGCHFHPRCNYCQDICINEIPEMYEIKEKHFVACHRANELTLKSY
jgi:oligopeptide/dipeptide ABC transporter ATP-binding protein